MRVIVLICSKSCISRSISVLVILQLMHGDCLLSFLISSFPILGILYHTAAFALHSSICSHLSLYVLQNEQFINSFTCCSTNYTYELLVFYVKQLLILVPRILTIAQEFHFLQFIHLSTIHAFNILIISLISLSADAKTACKTFSFTFAVCLSFDHFLV